MASVPPRPPRRSDPGPLRAAGRSALEHAWGVVRSSPPDPPSTATIGRCCGVYRRRNADQIARLVSPLRARGWEVRLWSLDEVPAELESVTVGRGPGGRTELLNRLSAGATGPVVLVDDDVEFDRGDLGRFVDAAAALRFDLAQPAHTWDSRFSHVFTLARPWLGARSTTFVEIGPIVYLSRIAAERLVPMPMESRMGWGIDVRWADVLRRGELRGGIVDRLPIRHLGEVALTYSSTEEEDQLTSLLRERGVRHITSLQRTTQRFRRSALEAARRPVREVPSGHVAVGPIPIADRGCGEVVGELVDPPRLPYVAFAVHVGALSSFGDHDYLDALAAADVTYADGHAIVYLAQLAGAQRVERTPTTDIGYDVVGRLAAERQVARVALVGGPPGLAERAGQSLERNCPGVEVVYSHDGFSTLESEDLARLRSSGPDVLFVGMGMPREAVWVARHLAELPPCRIVTCGGWFGFVAGDERRAPVLIQRLRLEWAFRMIQSPRRLAGRYAVGLIRTAVMAVRLRRMRGERG